jgi:type IV pilus assembly protein PilC
MTQKPSTKPSLKKGSPRQVKFDTVDAVDWVLGAPGSEKEPAKDLTINIRPPKVTLNDVAWLTKNLAKTQAAGMPLFRALGMLADMRKKDLLGDRIRSIQAQMSEDGASLTEAMRTYEKDFGSLVCALVEAGEAGGGLENSLRRAAELTEARVRLRRKIRAALVYPIAVVVITVSLIVSLLVFLVPRFEDIYASVGSELPALTQLLVTLSGYAPYGAAVLVALTAAYFVIDRRSRNDEALRRKLDEFRLNIPVIGSLLRKGVNARIASTLSSLLAAGVPLLQALEFSRSAAGNLVFSDSMTRIRENVSDGLALSEALDQEPIGLYPPLFVQYSAVGEEAGTVPELMDSYAREAEEEVEVTAEALTRLIEPVLMVVIGGVVGFFLIGLYMPMINIGDQIR